jgi:hypothetical protein
MLYREIIAVCSQIHTEHINALCGQNVELLNVKLAVYIVTIRVLQGKETLRKLTSTTHSVNLTCCLLNKQDTWADCSFPTIRPWPI